MPTLDTAADAALDEAVGLCMDPVGRHGALVRWLAGHRELAGALADALADCAEVEQWMNPLSADPPPADHPTMTLSDAAEGDAAGEPTSLDFGDFEVMSELGRGGMGVVYKARHKQLNRVVALKTILAAGFHTPRGVAHLRFEAEMAARLDHKNIVPILGAGEHQGMPFFSMKYVAGGTLADGLDVIRKNPRKAAELLAKVARAVEYAHHRGVIHRDLKPGNILIENGEPMVADFGLAKVTDSPGGWSASGAIVGTPAYMPPEQARGDKGLTTAVDVYALGAILYQLLTGRPPFRGETALDTLRQVIDQAPADPLTLNPNAPPDLVAVCNKCLEKQAENRYPSAAALAADLESFAKGESVSVRSRSVFSRLAGTLRGKREDFGTPGESWVGVTVRSVSVVAATHAAVFALVVVESRMPWVWAALVPYFVFALTVRLRALLRCRTYVPWEQHTVALWAGHTVCLIGLALAVLPFDSDAPASAALAWYPALAVVSALALFVQGSIHLGLNYPFSILYLILAVVFKYCGSAAPLLFLLVHCPALVILAVVGMRAVADQKGRGATDAVMDAPTVSRG